MFYIDESISEDLIHANERVLIEQYSLEVRAEGDRFSVLDKAVRKAHRGKGGRYVGGNLETLVRAAVNDHEAMKSAEAATAPEPTQAPEPQPAEEGKGKQSDPTSTIYLVMDEGQLELKPGTLPDTDGEAGASAVETQTRPDDEKTSSNDQTQRTTRKRGERVQIEEETTPAATNRAPKKREPKERKLNRYIRASRLIAEDKDMMSLELPHNGEKWSPHQKRLAGPAKMSVASAGHCLEAWIGVITVLKEKGWYTGPGDVSAAAGKTRKSTSGK